MATRRGAEAAKPALVVDAKAGGDHWWVRVRATGLWGGSVAAVLAIFVEMTKLDRVNPQHFLLMCLTCVVAGALFASAVLNGRVQDALSDKESYRAETNRLAERKAKLEERLLKKRESSVPPQKTR